MLRPELPGRGITRVAKQTGLDVVGIPCFAAIRPNARTLAVNQGKGPDDASAQVSAIMEAMEFAFAERPDATTSVASPEELSAAGRKWFIPARLLPRAYHIDARSPLTWLTGYELTTRETVYVPLDGAALAPNASETHPFSQSSNGLGAGMEDAGAIVHALCELVERDASTLWAMRSFSYCASSRVDVVSLVPAAAGYIETVRDAGLDVALFDLTTELGVPVMMAMLWSGSPLGYFDVASGVCAHPSAVRAIQGAVQEAAQTRISNIAGARDDIDPAEYLSVLPEWIRRIIAREPESGRLAPPSMPRQVFPRLPYRIGRTVVVPLNAESSGIRVVKLLSDTLEDKSTNVHWRPGARATRAMTAR